MISWRYKPTGRFHGTKDPDRNQENYTPSPVYRYVWDKPEEEEVDNGQKK